MVAFDIVISFSLNVACSVSAPHRMLTSCATQGAAVRSLQSRANLWMWPPLLGSYLEKGLGEKETVYWAYHYLCKLWSGKLILFVSFPSITVLDSHRLKDIDKLLIGTNDKDESKSTRNVNGQNIKLPFHWCMTFCQNCFGALLFWTKS